jgi:hypothetical protein
MALKDEAPTCGWGGGISPLLNMTVIVDAFGVEQSEMFLARLLVNGNPSISQSHDHFFQ